MWLRVARHAAPPLQATPSANAAAVVVRRCFARKSIRGGDQRSATDADWVPTTGSRAGVEPNSGLAAFTGLEEQPGLHASTSVSLPLKDAIRGGVDQTDAHWLWDDETGGGVSMGVGATQPRWRNPRKGKGFAPLGKGKSFASDSDEDDEVAPFRGEKGGKSIGFGPSGKGKNRSFAPSDSDDDEVVPFRGDKAGKGFGPSGKGKNRSFAQSDSDEDDEVAPFRGDKGGKSIGLGPSGKGKNRSFALSDSDEEDEVAPFRGYKGGRRMGFGPSGKGKNKSSQSDSEEDEVIPFHERTAGKGIGTGPSGKGKSESFAQSDSDGDEEVVPRRRHKGKGKRRGPSDLDSDDDELPLSRGVQGANMQPKGIYSPRGEAVRSTARSGSPGRRSYPDSDDEFFGAPTGFGGRSKGSDKGTGFGGVPSGKGKDGKHGRFDSMSFASDFRSKGKEGKRKGFDSMDFDAKGQKGRGNSFFDSGKFGKSKGGKGHDGKSAAGKGPGFKGKGKGRGYF